MVGLTLQGYMVAEYEMMSFDEFKAQFGGSGVIEYVKHPVLIYHQPKAPD